MFPLKVNYFLALVLIQLLGYGESQNLIQLQSIEASMDHTIDPCEDFYGFACGNWPKLHANRRYTGSGNFLLFQQNQKLVDFIFEEYLHKNQIKRHQQNFIDKTIAYAYSCLTIHKWEVLKYLNEIKPGPGLEWPLVELMKAFENGERNFTLAHWSTRQFDLFTLVSQLNSYGLDNVLLNQKSVRQNDDSVLTRVTVPLSELLDMRAVVTIFEEMSLDENVTRKYSHEILSTHLEWQEVYRTYALEDKENIHDTKNENAPIVSYDRLKQYYPRIYKLLINIIPADIRGDDQRAQVVISNLKYFQYLRRKIWKPDEMLRFCNYLMVKFLLYLKEINRASCSANLQYRLHLAFDYLDYKHSYLPQEREAQHDVSSLLKKTHKHLLEMVNENRLNLNSYQLLAINERLENLTLNEVLLQQNVNQSMVDDFYGHIPDLDFHNYYRNDLLVLKHLTLEPLLGLHTSRNFFLMAGYTSAQVYQRNSVVIPFGYLTLPMYNLNFDPLLSLAIFGAVLGHEFTHAINSHALGKKDIYGTPLEQPQVQAALECMLRQQPTKHIEERLGDLVGARVAFRTYSQEYNLQPNFTSIPWKQLFYLNLGQFFCGNPHGQPSGYDSNGVRLNQMAKNLDEFAEAFQCRVGSQMNPKRKCRFY